MSAPVELDRETAALFDYLPRTRVVYGPGTLSGIGRYAREVGGSRVLLVTDQGLRSTGQVDRCIASLDDAGLVVSVFDRVEPNPTTVDVDRALEIAEQAEIDLLIGFGGGSSLDCAKGVNFLLTNGGEMRDYAGVGKATREMLPMIAVPTTAGTGSEAQSFALIADAETHMKMACGDPKAACRLAILDPELTVSMPVGVAATTGIDAVTHAIESYVTTRRNEISTMFSLRAWTLLQGAFPRIFASPDDIKLRGEMMLGAHFAGAAIENSMLGAAHALANPLSAHFGTTHGIAVGVMLPHVIRYNDSAARKWYGELAHAAGLCEARDERASHILADRVTELVAAGGCPTDLRQCHVEADMVPVLAAEAAQQWTGRFNPRPVATSDFEELYRCALSPCC